MNIFNIITNKQLIYDINSLISSLIYESKIIKDPKNHIISQDEIELLLLTIEQIHNIDDNLYDNIIEYIKEVYNIEKYNKKRKCYKSYVISLKEKDNIEQRTEKWYKIRENMLTASDWGAALGMNKYTSKKKILNNKIYGSTFTGNKYTQWGVKYEPIASDFYALKTKKKLIEFGLIQHKKYDFLGASPDNISECGIMLEIKCPYSREINGTVPLHYWVQMQAQLEVCELERCDYIECKIIEYNNELEYLNDNTKYKGSVIEIYDSDNNKLDYHYSKFNLNKEELDKFKNSLNKDNNKSYKTTYWKIDKYFIVPIYRDRIWFNNSINDLKDFWNIVITEKSKFNDIFDD